MYGTCPDKSILPVERAEPLYKGAHLEVTLNPDTNRMAPAAEAIVRDCAEIADMLIRKNTAYGNSALNPLRVFSKASTEEQILVRIDDKLSRLQRGQAAGEDVVADLIGYLILLRIARKTTIENP